MINKKINKKGMALSQVCLLVLGIIAIAFIAGIQMPVVSAETKTCTELEGVCAEKRTYNCIENGKIIPFDLVAKCDYYGQGCCLGSEVSYKVEAPLVIPVAQPDIAPNAVVPTPEDGKSPAQEALVALTSVGSGVMAVKSIQNTLKPSTAKTAAELLKEKKAFADLKAAEVSAGAESSVATEATKVGALAKFKYGFFNKAPFEGAKGLTAEQSAHAVKTGGYALQTAAFAMAGATIAIMAFKLAGTGERNMRQIKTGAYTAAAATTVTLVAIKIIAVSSTAPVAGWMVAGIVAAATAVWAAFTYQTYSREIFTYQLNVWQPESKGERCTECNDLRYGCSEYQCKTFGAACAILNPGTEVETCDWENPNDVKPPIMTQLDILDTGYSYNPNEKIQLPDRGVELVYRNQCIPPFTSVKFGVETDEPAECKIDLERKFNYNEMVSLMSEGPVYTYNHTLEIPSSAFPSNYSLTEAGWTVAAGQDHSFYIRCKDTNDNISPYHFVLNFCVDQGPDTTPPTISTNYLNGAYISYNQSTIDDLNIYTNEPADCRWDYKDVEYEKMEQSMDDCSTTVGEYTFPTTYSYGCRTSLSGLKNGEQNKFYIRCEDKPLLQEGSQERRVANEESYELILQGTNQLVIDSIKVNEEEAYSTNKEIDDEILIQDSTDVIAIKINVETTQGADKIGSSRCSYSPFNGDLRYEFYNNGNFEYISENTHTFNLDEDYYNYGVQCCDAANNCDTAEINFIVDTDLNSPSITRAYYEEGNMKLVADEESSCVYMLGTCNYLFEDGVKFITKDNIDHFIKWDASEDLYVKCKDNFGNVPVDTCSIIVRATDKYVGENKAAKESLDIDF